MPKLIDLTNQRFGKLVVLKRAEKNISNRPAWVCQCDCGNVKIISGHSLKLGTQSCGCYVKEKLKEIKKIDMPIGSKWGHWTVLQENGQDEYGYYHYLCQCDCGTIKTVSGHSLRNGDSTSCGLCLRNSIIGKKFGLLTIIGINEEQTDSKNLYVDCLCECGNKATVMYGNLKREEKGTKSCGCLKQSYGEYRVNQLLSQFNIPYKQYKTFDDCRFKDTNRKAIFDFYVNNQYIIEVDGKQHFYKSCEFYPGGFEETREHDIFKNNWCKEKNIPIIRIPFNKINSLTITDLLLETSNFILKGDDSYFTQF